MSPSLSTDARREAERFVRGRMSRREASLFLRALITGAWRHMDHGSLWNPTTAELRAALRSDITPPGVKNHVYQMLRVRRARSRWRRHGH